MFDVAGDDVCAALFVQTRELDFDRAELRTASATYFTRLVYNDDDGDKFIARGVRALIALPGLLHTPFPCIFSDSTTTIGGNTPRISAKLHLLWAGDKSFYIVGRKQHLLFACRPIGVFGHTNVTMPPLPY